MGIEIGLPVRRRQYYVRAPMSLWHIDGNHKLIRSLILFLQSIISMYLTFVFVCWKIRWRFVTHGGIDGFSRRVVFLRVSNNNRAETVLAEFRRAVELVGLPARVRLVDYNPFFFFLLIKLVHLEPTAVERMFA